jgi:hypothetical protein
MGSGAIEGPMLESGDCIITSGDEALAVLVNRCLFMFRCLIRIRRGRGFREETVVVAEETCDLEVEHVVRGEEEVVASRLGSKSWSTWHRQVDDTRPQSEQNETEGGIDGLLSNERAFPCRSPHPYMRLSCRSEIFVVPQRLRLRTRIKLTNVRFSDVAQPFILPIFIIENHSIFF